MTNDAMSVRLTTGFSKDAEESGTLNQDDFNIYQSKITEAEIES